MKILITNGTIVNGKHAYPGEVVEVDNPRPYFENGKAVPYADEPKKPTTRKKPVTTKNAASTVKGKAKK